MNFGLLDRFKPAEKNIHTEKLIAIQGHTVLRCVCEPYISSTGMCKALCEGLQCNRQSFHEANSRSDRKCRKIITESNGESYVNHKKKMEI